VKGAPVEEFDIDISGDAELPPGAQEGSLGGTDEPPEAPTPVTTSADELDASFDAALGGDEDFGAIADTPPPEGEQFMTSSTAHPEPVPAPEPVSPESPGVREPEPEPSPETEPEAGAEPEKPAPKRRARKKAAPKKKKADDGAEGSSKPSSGAASRLYAIFQKHQVEVDGRITEAFVRVAFANPDDSQAPLTTVKARNRDTALHKAGILFGHGFEGTLVATPVGMWEEKPVRNTPREQFRVEVGA
jgi:outer membrane biosynthesis protein TonB